MKIEKNNGKNKKKLSLLLSTPTRAAFVSRLLVMEIGKLNFCTPEMNWVFMHT